MSTIKLPIQLVLYKGNATFDNGTGVVPHHDVLMKIDELANELMKHVVP